MPSPSNLTVARQWRKQAVSDREWKPCANQIGVKTGEAGGYLVEAESFDRRGYLKPANAHGDELIHCRAAREKIASDLAFDLGLDIPPVQLTRRVNPPPGCTPFVCISLVQYPKQWSWGEVKGTIVQETPAGVAYAAALSKSSPLLAFDTWIDQRDHNDHPENVIWGYDPKHLDQSSIVFLDYANALGFNNCWAAKAWQVVTRAVWMTEINKYIDPSALQQTVEKIEQFADLTIEEVVNRIPSDYLADAEKAIIIEGLMGRRSLVRNALVADLVGAET